MSVTDALPASLEELATSRLAVYRFLLAAFDKPSAEQHAWLAGPAFRRALEELGEKFGVAAPAGELAAADPADHEARYIACFEVGLPQPPVVLQASHYQRREPVPQVIHEHVLFRQRFGAPLATPQEPADHLLNELAFLIHLDELAARRPERAAAMLRARQDYLSRHAARWPAQAAAAAEAKRLPALYCALLRLLEAATAQDLDLTQNHLAEPARGPS